MILVENKREIIASANGSAAAKLDIQVSTAADLPEKDAIIGGFRIQPGSIAQIIQTGVFVTMDEDGRWYPEQ